MPSELSEDVPVQDLLFTPLQTVEIFDIVNASQVDLADNLVLKTPLALPSAQDSASDESILTEARKMAQELRDNYRKANQPIQYETPGDLFEYPKRKYKVGDIVEAHDSLTGERYGVPYQMVEDGVWEPLLDGKPIISRRVILGKPKAKQVESKMETLPMGVKLTQPIDDDEMAVITKLYDSPVGEGIEKPAKFDFIDYLKRKDSRVKNFREKGESVLARRENLQKSIKAPRRKWFRFNF